MTTDKGKIRVLLSLALALSFIFCIFSSDISDAEGTFTVDGITYSVTSGTEVSVSYSSSYYGIINIPSNVTYGGMEYKVTSVGTGTFRSCTEIGAISLPETVRSIGDEAFKGCGTVSVFVLAGHCTLGIDAFDSCDANIFVHANNIDHYRTSERWSELSDRISVFRTIDTPYRVLEYDGGTKVFMNPTGEEFSLYDGTFKATDIGDYNASLTPNAGNGYLWSDTLTCENRQYLWSIADPYVETIPDDPPVPDDSTPIVVALWVVVGVLVAIAILALVRRQ